MTLPRNRGAVWTGGRFRRYRGDLTSSEVPKVWVPGECSLGLTTTEARHGIPEEGGGQSRGGDHGEAARKESL